jgi:uncharacterized OB-fold protein
MAYFPDDMPGVEPNWDDREFWAACAERRLLVQACAACDTPRHPPSPMCPVCHSTRIRWLDAPDRGRIYSFTVVRHASHPAVTSRLPYVVAVIEFPELHGVRLVSNVTDADPATMKIGQSVDLWWDQLTDGTYLPRFRPSAGA